MSLGKGAWACTSMNVAGHDHKSMQSIVPEDLRVVHNSLDNHAGKGWLAEVERTSASLVQ